MLNAEREGGWLRQVLTRLGASRGNGEAKARLPSTIVLKSKVLDLALFANVQLCPYIRADYRNPYLESRCGVWRSSGAGDISMQLCHDRGLLLLTTRDGPLPRSALQVALLQIHPDVETVL